MSIGYGTLKGGLRGILKQQIPQPGSPAGKDQHRNKFDDQEGQGHFFCLSTSFQT